jgi:L-iditol 2-dehydrogenase
VVDPRSSAPAARIRALTCGTGVNVALDCSGTPAAQRLCLDAVRRLSTVAFVDEPATRVSTGLIRKGLRCLAAVTIV